MISLTRRGSALPSLKQEKVKVKKPDIKTRKVGQSDADSVTNAFIKYSSLPPVLDSRPIEPSKDFDFNRPNDFPALFLTKVHQCKTIIDNRACKSSDRKAKVTLLTQLLKAFQSPILVRKLNNELVEELIKMVSINIQRNFPTVKEFPQSFLFDRVENFCDDSWPVLQYIYSLLEALLTSTHVPQAMLNTSVSQGFVTRLFACLASPDHRERHAVKSSLYAIAGRIPERSVYLFMLMKNSMIDAINGQPIHRGLPQVLELFNSMIATIPQFTSLSFAIVMPQIFMPLHLMSNLAAFHSQLVNNVDVILSRNPRFVDPFLLFLLNHFPIASQKKQMVFLGEIDNLVGRFWQVVLPHCGCMILSRISALFSSPCEEISERALTMMFSDGFVGLLKQYFSRIAPIIMIRANSVTKKHWHDVPQNLAMCLLQELHRIDPVGFSNLTGGTGSIRLTFDDKAAQRDATWRTVRETAEQLHNPERALTIDVNISSNTNANNTAAIRQKTPSARTGKAPWARGGNARRKKFQTH